MQLFFRTEVADMLVSLDSRVEVDAEGEIEESRLVRTVAGRL